MSEPAPGMGQLMHLLGKLEGMMTAVLQRVDGIEKDVAKAEADTTTRLNNHADRIGNLEKTHAKAEGGLKVGTIAVTVAWTLILAGGGLVAWIVASGIHITNVP